MKNKEAKKEERQLKEVLRNIYVTERSKRLSRVTKIRKRHAKIGKDITY